jgi:PAS domain S-box-containing protein
MMNIALEQIPAVIFAKDLAGRYMYANARALEFWGVTWEELEGKTDAEMWVDLGSLHSEKFMKDDKHVMETGICLMSIQQAAIRKKGQGIAPVLVNKSPLRNEAGTIIGVIGVLIPLTL